MCTVPKKQLILPFVHTNSNLLVTLMLHPVLFLPIKTKQELVKTKLQKIIFFFLLKVINLKFIGVSFVIIFYYTSYGSLQVLI